MKAAFRPLFVALSVASLTLALAAGCDDGDKNTGADVAAGTDTPLGSDGTTGNPDSTTGNPDSTTGNPDSTTGTPDAKTDNGGGSDTTVTPDTTTAPFCGDGVCNGGESQLTCPGDCGGSTTQTSYLCHEIQGCFGEKCGSLTGQEFQTCANAAINAGGQCQSPPAELQLFLADNQCLATKCASATTAIAQLECLRANCLATGAACNAGGPPMGAGFCGGIFTCLQTCPATGATAGTCTRACFAAATASANELFLDLIYCANAACASTPAAQQQACFQSALNPNGGACAVPFNACQVDGTVVEPDPTPDAAGDTSTPDAADATADAAAPDATQDAGPTPDVTPTPDAAPGDAGGAGFFPFRAGRFIPTQFGQ
jgi:hypothetical protein